MTSLMRRLWSDPNFLSAIEKRQVGESVPAGPTTDENELDEEFEEVEEGFEVDGEETEAEAGIPGVEVMFAAVGGKRKNISKSKSKRIKRRPRDKSPGNQDPKTPAKPPISRSTGSKSGGSGGASTGGGGGDPSNPTGGTPPRRSIADIQRDINGVRSIRNDILRRAQDLTGTQGKKTGDGSQEVSPDGAELRKKLNDAVIWGQKAQAEIDAGEPSTEKRNRAIQKGQEAQQILDELAATERQLKDLIIERDRPQQEQATSR